MIRPTGAEPEIEAYLEVVEHVTGRTLAVARQAAELRMARLRTAVADMLA